MGSIPKRPAEDASAYRGHYHELLSMKPELESGGARCVLFFFLPASVLVSRASLPRRSLLLHPECSWFHAEAPASETINGLVPALAIGRRHASHLSRIFLFSKPLSRRRNARRRKQTRKRSCFHVPRGGVAKSKCTSSRCLHPPRIRFPCFFTKEQVRGGEISGMKTWKCGFRFSKKFVHLSR